MIRLGCTIVLLAGLVVGVANQLAAQEQEQERKVTRRDLPAAVAKTVDAQSHGATIRGYSEEKENGQTFYEVELRVNGHTRDVLIDANGAVVEVEEEVDLAALPAAVRDALNAGAGSGKIGVVESVTKGGQIVAYEAHVTTNGKKSEVKVGPDGKPLQGEP
jgi:hypothetical protein